MSNRLLHPSFLNPLHGHVHTSGKAHGSGEVEAGDQNAPRPPAYSSKPGLEVKDHFDASKSTGGVSTRGEVGGVSYEAGVQGPTLSVDGQAKAKVSTSGIDVHADVNIDATLVQAGAKAEKVIPVTLPGGEQIQVKVDLAASGAVGAKGDLKVDVHVGTDGKVTAQVRADGFVGAKAGLTGSVTLTHGSEVIAHGDATLSAYAGAAGALDVHGSIGLHEVDFGAKAAASFGAGFGVELNGGFDPMAALHLVGAVAKDVAEQGLESGVSGVESGASAAGSAIGDAAGTAGKAIGDAAGTAGKAIGDAAGTAGKAIGDAAGTAGKAIGDTAGKIGQVISGWF